MRWWRQKYKPNNAPSQVLIDGPQLNYIRYIIEKTAIECECGFTGSQSTVLSPHVLHWVVFVPPPSMHPMSIENSSLSAFSIPSWGGVHILNKNCSCSEEQCRTCLGEVLAEADHERIASVFVAQLRGLLDLDESPLHNDNSGFVSLSAGAAGFADWELDILLRKRVASDVAAASQTLQALQQLMDELPNLEMPNFIGFQARFTHDVCFMSFTTFDNLEVRVNTIFVSL